MINLNTNILFNYLYRDYSNYKKYGNVVFSNPNNISLQEIEKTLRGYFVDGQYFDAAYVGLPLLFFEVSNIDDHELHEFESIQTTKDEKYFLTIEEFISKLI